jgi:hypothetical protein
MDDGWEDLGAVAARVIEKVAPAGEVGGAADATSRHGGGGKTAVILEFRGRRSGAAQPEGPTWPPRHSTIDTVSDFITSKNTPATGGLGNARRAKR